ncbi:MAG: hypothetical protein ACI9N9_000601 [Enterobacterales bacterium]|jgi:hypothetical protein
MNSKIYKYLEQYAEKEVQALNSFPSALHLNNAVVIPAYNENAHFLTRYIQSQLSTAANVLILVINQPVSELDSTPQQQLELTALSYGQVVWKNLNLSLIKFNEAQGYLLLIDRFSLNYQIDDKQGVGLARKIGADIATALIHASIIKSPWICSTDADTHLPDNYFSCLDDLTTSSAALIYSFKHLDHHDAISKATLTYEKSLRYYVSGLAWAGSNYAFHTIGSTIALNYNYYAMVRGFPKRSAGEDFYLLNKLAKLAPIETITHSTLYIEPRISSRVPFGTGPAVEKIMLLPTIEDYLYYHPTLFLELKNCLLAMNQLWQYKDQPERWLALLSKSSQQALLQLRISKLFEHIQSNIKTNEQCTVHTHQWFDAFRTLKFFHYQQADFYPQIALTQAITKAMFTTH